MKLQDFIEKLEESGWEGVYDSQRERIALLHGELFPVVASLEAEVIELQEEIADLSDTLEDIDLHG